MINNISKLSVKSLSVVAGGREILRPETVTFDIAPGEIVGLLGPNGSGKSTMLRTICGLSPKRSGAIGYGTRDIGLMNIKDRARTFGYVAQNEIFTSAYTVMESVVMGRYPHLARFESYGEDDYAIARAALLQVGLSGFEERSVVELSGGESARVLMARALTQQSPILLLDEPTAALDPRHSQIVMNLVGELAAEGKMILVALHDINLALGHVDRTIFMKEGNIVSDRDTPDIDEEILEQVYDISWEISYTGHSGRRIAIPAD